MTEKELLEQKINAIALEEQSLTFPEFDQKTALDLGLAVLRKARQEQVAVTIDIRRGDHILFHYSMPGTGPNNDRWVERKSNTVQLIQKSSYRVGLELALKGDTLENRQALDPAEYASHGGSFPIRVKGAGLIGAVTVSGLPQEEDHALVVASVKELLGE
jgi:uncharacterized protein (UPF0303 family)